MSVWEEVWNDTTPGKWMKEEDNDNHHHHHNNDNDNNNNDNNNSNNNNNNLYFARVSQSNTGFNFSLRPSDLRIIPWMYCPLHQATAQAARVSVPLDLKHVIMLLGGSSFSHVPSIHNLSILDSHYLAILVDKGNVGDVSSSAQELL